RTQINITLPLTTNMFTNLPPLVSALIHQIHNLQLSYDIIQPVKGEGGEDIDGTMKQRFEYTENFQGFKREFFVPFVKDNEKL
ncbi:MAG: hypothetical protein WBP64_14395, partial [Nitrososphaeraceae archaeon]